VRGVYNPVDCEGRLVRGPAPDCAIRRQLLLDGGREIRAQDICSSHWCTGDGLPQGIYVYDKGQFRREELNKNG
jgi:hypothetical protein